MYSGVMSDSRQLKCKDISDTLHVLTAQYFDPARVDAVV